MQPQAPQARVPRDHHRLRNLQGLQAPSSCERLHHGPSPAIPRPGQPWRDRACSPSLSSSKLSPACGQKYPPSKDGTKLVRYTTFPKSQTCPCKIVLWIVQKSCRVATRNASSSPVSSQEILVCLMLQCAPLPHSLKAGIHVGIRSASSASESRHPMLYCL